eukprot:4558584-Prymnesium_polylepis.1
MAHTHVLARRCCLVRSLRDAHPSQSSVLTDARTRSHKSQLAHDRNANGQREWTNRVNETSTHNSTQTRRTTVDADSTAATSSRSSPVKPYMVGSSQARGF